MGASREIARCAYGTSLYFNLIRQATTATTTTLGKESSHCLRDRTDLLKRPTKLQLLGYSQRQQNLSDDNRALLLRLARQGMDAWRLFRIMENHR